MNFKKRILQMKEAATTPETVPTPAPETETEFQDPAVALEDLRDQLGEIRSELERERERRAEAERKAEQVSRPRSLQEAFHKPARFK